MKRARASALDVAPLCDLNAPVVLFPVRHHSPTAARLVRELILRLRPGAVLVEGPADFNGRMSELFLPHRPPLAVYSFVRLPTGDRRGAYYPFCEHSPEWQALRIGHDLGAAMRFIDLPWADVAASRRRAEQPLRRRRVPPQRLRRPPLPPPRRRGLQRPLGLPL